MGTSRWSVDQEVLVVDGRRAEQARRKGETYEPQHGVIIKVGRTLVHVAIGPYGRPTKFYADTGHENAGQFTGMYRIFTPQGWAEEADRERIITRLRQQYDVSMWRISDELSLQTLTTIHDAIAADLGR